MIFKTLRKTNLRTKLATIFILSAFVCCSKVFATGELDFSYYNLVEAKPTKLLNPISLDTSKTVKPNSTIPFHLREFSEEEYFSSTIDDNVKVEKIKPIKLENLPAPSEYKPVKNIEQKTVSTNSGAENFFAPLPENNELYTTETSDKTEVKESAYFASATEDSYNNNSDLDGKPISNLLIKGLNTLDTDIITSKINTRPNTLFNTDLIQQDLQRIYSTGYFTDEMEVEPILNDDGTIDLYFTVKENIIVKNVIIKGNNVISSVELFPLVEELKNKPQNLYKINEAIEKIQTLYRDKSYILANVASVDDDLDGNLSLNIQEGIINEIKFAGNEKTKDYIIQRNIMTQPGTVYNEEYLKKDLAKVFSTQIFEEVDRNITPSENDDGTFDVTIVVKEKSNNSIGLGGGVDTGLGAFGSISLKDDNFLGKAQKVSLTGIIGSGILLSDSSIKNHMNYQAELSFFEPYFINADNSLMSKIYYREMGSFNIPLAIERRIGANIGVEHKIRGYDNLSTNFIAGVEHINLKEGDYGRIAQLYNKYHLDIKDRAKQLSDGFFLNLSPGIKYSKLDNNELPREGIVAQARFTESIGISDFNHTNGRLSGMVTKFYPVAQKSTFSLTAKAGVKMHGDEMPEIMAYRLGGPYTIRGFRMNGVGSGESFFMGTAELATPLPFSDKLKWEFIKKMRLTFFVDAGKVFDPTISSVLYDRPLHAITAGIGLRMYIPGIGPMSIDYGIPITNPGSNGSENGYFTFGAGGFNMYGY